MNKSNNMKAFEEFVKTLPDLEEWQKSLVNLQFFALCPNGKRIPVKSICEEYSRDPTGLVYRTFEDRLVLVIQAIHPDLSEPYWNQAFYLSTGESSGMPGTWLPFNGILMKGEVSRKIYAVNPRLGIEYRNRKANEKTIKTTGWFSKMDFAAPQMRDFPTWSTNESATLEERMKNKVWQLYSRFYLPEGKYLHYRSRFDRFGTISYALASHAIGGNLFEHKYTTKTNNPSYPYLSHFFTNVDYSVENTTSTERILADVLYPSSPLQSCFQEMATTYPITKPNIVNAYIDKHNAITYMNAFRQEKVFPPGLSYVQVPIPSLGYSMPIEQYWGYLDGYVKKIWIQWKIGKLSIDEIKETIAHPEKEIRKTIKGYREYNVMPNEPNIKYNLHREKYAEKPEVLDYYGGKRNTRKRLSRKKRIYTRRQH